MFSGVKGLLDCLRRDWYVVPNVGKLLTTFAVQHPGSKNVKTRHLWESMPCCIIKIYQCFRGKNKLPYSPKFMWNRSLIQGVTSQKTSILSATALRTLNATFSVLILVYFFLISNIFLPYLRPRLSSVSRRVRHWSPHWHTQKLLSAAWCWAVCLGDRTARTLNKRRLQKDEG